MNCDPREELRVDELSALTDTGRLPDLRIEIISSLA
jgi:hypothetical protein